MFGSEARSGGRRLMICFRFFGGTGQFGRGDGCGGGGGDRSSAESRWKDNRKGSYRASPEKRGRGVLTFGVLFCFVFFSVSFSFIPCGSVGVRGSGASVVSIYHYDTISFCSIVSRASRDLSFHISHTSPSLYPVWHRTIPQTPVRHW